MSAQKKNSDPFARYGPNAVECHWLSKEDADRAKDAEIVRLVVDDNRWAVYWANEVYQRNTLKEIAEFLGSAKAVVVTPAGMVTFPLTRLPNGQASLADCITEVDNAIRRLKREDQPDFLLGVDGCIPGEVTPLQTVVHLDAKTQSAGLTNTTVKVYPAGGEWASLLGWTIRDQHKGKVPGELSHARRVKTAAGTVLVLVCFDAGCFSNRSRATSKYQLRIDVRKHLQEEAEAKPAPQFVLIATHHLTMTSGTFQNAASNLADETGSTVVTTMFAPKKDLERVAKRFWTKGPKKDKVVTLLVEDR